MQRCMSSHARDWVLTVLHAADVLAVAMMVHIHRPRAGRSVGDGVQLLAATICALALCHHSCGAILRRYL